MRHFLFFTNFKTFWGARHIVFFMQFIIRFNHITSFITEEIKHITSGLQLYWYKLPRSFWLPHSPCTLPKKRYCIFHNSLSPWAVVGVSSTWCEPTTTHLTIPVFRKLWNIEYLNCCGSKKFKILIFILIMDYKIFLVAKNIFEAILLKSFGASLFSWRFELWNFMNIKFQKNEILKFARLEFSVKKRQTHFYA